jgi:hypothetical protein
MKTTFTILTSFVLSISFSSAQITFQKTIGGSLADFGNSVRQTMDGGYIIAGTFNSDSSSNAYLIKTDALGNVEWKKTYDAASNDEEATSVEQSADSGFIVGASMFGDSIQGYIIRTDANGDTLWTRIQHNVPVIFARLCMQLMMADM